MIGHLVMYALLPALLIGPLVLIWLAHLADQARRRGARFPWQQLPAVLALLVGTGVLSMYALPRRVAFAISRSSFAQVLDDAPRFEHGSAPLDRWLGAYWVDAYAADPRGGVYFRVHTDFFGGTDYGFAYKPNEEGSPFGAISYRVFRLGGDWYEFRARSTDSS